MQIIEMVTLDNAGRIGLRKLFADDEIPERALVTFDTKTGHLLFLAEKDIPTDWQIPTRQLGVVDSKCRLTVPVWVRRAFGVEFLVTTESRSKHFLLARGHLHCACALSA